VKARRPSVASGQGFSLVEVAIALTVAAALSIGLGQLASSRIETDRTRAAQAQLAEARMALLGFVQSNGRLPCPAEPTLDAAHPQAGQERPRTRGECSGGYGGTLPWTTLGVAPLDPWGHRLSYRVVTEFANDIDECTGELSPARSICVRQRPVDPWPAHRDALEVRHRKGPGPLLAATETVASALAVVVVMHGPDGSGAHDQTGRVLPAAAGSDAARNADLASVSFVTRDVMPGQFPCSDEVLKATPCGFDDRLTWISRAEILLALARAGRLD